MAAELGQTNDPRALVPGDPGAIYSTEASMKMYGSMLREAGAGLGRIDTVGGWSGQAADGFRKVYHGQPGKWIEAADAFGAAASALDTYASSLTDAQQQAAEAIRLYNDGQAATEAGKAQHAQDVQAAQQQAAVQAANGIPSVVPNIPFVDPGEVSRAAARHLLETARAQLKGAGDGAATVVGRARDKAPARPGFWSHVGNFFGTAARDAEHAGSQVLNAVASTGNAMAHHPGDMAAAAGGLALTAVSGIGDGLGGLLDATGVGAVAGIPINVVSTAGVAAGLSITTVAMADVSRHAASDDKVSPDDSGGGGSGRQSERNPAGPSESNIWQKFQNYQGKLKTNGLGGKARQYFKWDYTHNDIEIFDRRGDRLGVMDPTTGATYGDPIPGRAVKL